MSHFIKKCSCDKIISQCRCPGPKTIQVLEHPACEGKAPNKTVTESVTFGGVQSAYCKQCFKMACSCIDKVLDNPSSSYQKAEPELTSPAPDEALTSIGGTGSIPTSPYRLQLPKQKFGTILADPPWRLRTGGVKRKLVYDTMDLEDIKAMAPDIDALCTPDTHLWLWTTNPHLPESLEVVSSWGFEYKCLLTWKKDKMGLGWWLRSKTEHVILAVRSNKKRVQPGNITTVFEAKRRKHSQKPDEIYPIIETLSPGPYIELFARETRTGWTTMISDAKASNPYGQT